MELGRVEVFHASRIPEEYVVGSAQFRPRNAHALFPGPILSPAGLSDLQSTALSAIYLYGTSAPHSSWLITGIGLRFAQDIGAHREKVSRGPSGNEYSC